MSVRRLSNSTISTQGRGKSSTFLAGYSPAIDEMDLIERVSLSASAASITFSNIPQMYQHLQIRMTARSSRSAATQEEISMQFNSDTGNNYAFHELYGIGTSTGAGALASTNRIVVGYVTGNTAISNNFGMAIIDILDYTSTSKTTVARSIAGTDNNGNGIIGIHSGMWTNTNAVTSVTLVPRTGPNWLQYSIFSLYGVKA